MEPEGIPGGVFDQPIVCPGGSVGTAGIEELKGLRRPASVARAKGRDLRDVGAAAPVTARWSRLLIPEFLAGPYARDPRLIGWRRLIPG